MTAQCPTCGGDSGVIDSRMRKHDGVIRRRRRCKECRHTWSTAEILLEDKPPSTQELTLALRTIRTAAKSITEVLDKVNKL